MQNRLKKNSESKPNDDIREELQFESDNDEDLATETQEEKGFNVVSLSIFESNRNNQFVTIRRNILQELKNYFDQASVLNTCYIIENASNEDDIDDILTGELSLASPSLEEVLKRCQNLLNDKNAKNVPLRKRLFA